MSFHEKSLGTPISEGNDKLIERVAALEAPETDLLGTWRWFEDNLIAGGCKDRIVEAVMDCPEDHRLHILDSLLDALRPGWPKAMMINLMQEAGWWADNSTREEKKAYMLACYRRLPLKDKKAFLTYITGKAE